VHCGFALRSDSLQVACHEAACTDGDVL